MLLKLIIASSCICLSYSLPTIDPGVFVLQGVPSCRQGKGYCVLGTNCSIDKDFEFDKNNGHCDEVTKSFTSLLSFVCCRFVRDRQDEDEYHTTILPFTIMEEKFQVLDQNPIPIEESYDTEISEDEDIENLVDIVGVVTDSTGIISLVTRPYQPPVKSSTTSTTASTISSIEVSSTFDENLRFSPEVSTSAQSSLSTWGAVIDFINNETSTQTNTAQESVEQPVSVSSSLESSLKEKVPFQSSTVQEEPPLESVENQKPNANASANAADIKLNISAIDNDHKVISLDDGVSSTRPSNLITPSSSDTITTTTDLIFDTLTSNNSFVKESIETLKSQLIAQNNSTITSSTNTTTIANTLENSNDVLFEESRNSPEEPYIDPDVINQILPTLLSSEVSSSQKSTTTETPLQFTSLPPRTSIKEMINNQNISIETSTSSQKLFNNDLFQGKEQQENNIKFDENKQSENNKNQLKNQVQVLNLPEEIRNYLLRKQAEKKQNTERIKLPINLKKDKIDDSGINTTSTSFIEQAGNKLEGNMTSTTPNPVTENILQTEKYSGLKGSNPLVPILLKKNNTESATQGQENKMVTTAFLYNEENGQTWTGHNEFTTIKTTLLQKYNGPNIIELGNEMRENEEGEMEGNVLPHPINLNICGLKSPNLMLSEQARAASTYDWCWSAALMRKEGRIDRFECSGTLVELDLVVTTAACLKRLRSKDLSNYRVVVGDSNLRDELPYGVQYLDIDEIVTHPDYLTSAGAHANDIGIIRLRDVATIDHNVCLACVAQRNAFIPSHTCVVSGYTLGNIPQDIRRDVEGFSPMEGILRESLVNLQKPSDCQSSIRKLSPNPLLLADPKSFLCDVKRKSARSCTNTLDGGSPLVCEVGGRWFLAGIASWSRDCSSDPNIYTRVSSFSDWFLNTRLRMYGFVSHRL